MIPGDAFDRGAQIIQILAKKVAGTLPGEDNEVPVQSRMGLGNLLYHAVNQVKHSVFPEMLETEASPVTITPSHVNGLPEAGNNTQSNGHDAHLSTESYDMTTGSFQLSDWLR
jgi:hypothetical protein